MATGTADIAARLQFEHEAQLSRNLFDSCILRYSSFPKTVYAIKSSKKFFEAFVDQVRSPKPVLTEKISAFNGQLHGFSGITASPNDDSKLVEEWEDVGIALKLIACAFEQV